jgi:hypothetical protein
MGGVIGAVCAAAATVDKVTKAGTRRRCIDALVNAYSQYRPKQKPFRKLPRGGVALTHHY